MTIGAGGELDFPDGKAAVVGNITIGGTGSATTITPTALGTNALYVNGDAAFAEAFTTEGIFYVGGNAEFKDALNMAEGQVPGSGLGNE